MPFNQHSRTVKIIRKQVNWQEDTKDELWQQIIEYKINNQSKVLYRFTGDKERFIQLQSYIAEIKPGDISNREGHAAKVYFNTVFGKEFSRSYDCIENAMLNYGYAIIRAYITRAIVSYGYNPSLGVFHKSEYNSFCLADDFLEIFRPIVDACVVNYLLESEEDIEFLSQEVRAYLVGMLSLRVRFDNQYQKISTVIDKFVLQCFDYLDSDIENKREVSNVEINTIEGIKK
jgi:CRISPR-associated protein Cas1